MKNIFLILLISIGIFCCSHKEKKHYQIIGICEKIIIQDTINILTINFLVSYKNTSKEDVLIFTNFISDSRNGKKYKNEGVFLKLANKQEPIGQFYPLNYFNIKPNEEIKILYTFKEAKSDNKDLIKLDKSFLNQIKLMEMYYKANHNGDSKKIEKQTNQSSNLNTITSDFPIIIDGAVIEFKKEINIEEAVKLVGGKINK